MDHKNNDNDSNKSVVFKLTLSTWAVSSTEQHRAPQEDYTTTTMAVAVVLRLGLIAVK